MRAAVAGLQSPHHLAPTLPGIYQGQDLTERWCAALDEVLAPVVSTLDCLRYYLDVSTAPDDFLPWLAQWLGLRVDPGQSVARRREVLLAASQLHGWQGTARGLELAVESMFGFRSVVAETGGASWSLDADAPLPGSREQALVVQVFVPAGQSLDPARLDTFVTSLKPAHVVHRVEVLPEGPGQPAGP